VPALAAFDQPFPPEAPGTASALVRRGGGALDAQYKLWVGDISERRLEQLELQPSASSDAGVLSTIKVAIPPSSIAVARSTTGDLYVASANAMQLPIEVLSSTGAHLETWRTFEEPYIAIDNSTEPLMDPSACGAPPLSHTECIVYVSAHGTDPTVHAVEKLDSRGLPVAFSDAKSCASEGCTYIQGNRIFGHPGAGCGATLTLTDYNTAVAVDAQGDIYVAVPTCAQIFEYRPSGEYVRAFELEAAEVPRVGKQQVLGAIEQIAIAPASGHLLVWLVAPSEGGGREAALDEFDTESGRFVHQTAE